MMRAKDIRAAVRSLRNGNSRLALDRIALLQSASRKNTRRSAREKPAGFVPCGHLACVCTILACQSHPLFPKGNWRDSTGSRALGTESPRGRRGLMLAYQFGPGARQRGCVGASPGKLRLRRRTCGVAARAFGGNGGIRWAPPARRCARSDPNPRQEWRASGQLWEVCASMRSGVANPGPELKVPSTFCRRAAKALLMGKGRRAS